AAPDICASAAAGLISGGRFHLRSGFGARVARVMDVAFAAAARHVAVPGLAVGGRERLAATILVGIAAVFMARARPAMADGVGMFLRHDRLLAWSRNRRCGRMFRRLNRPAGRFARPVLL